MKHVLASVALLGLVMGCDSTDAPAEDTTQSNATTEGVTMGDAGASDGNSGDGVSGDSTAAVTTGSGFSSGTFGNGGIGTTGGTLTGGPGSVGGVGGAGGDSGAACDDGAGGEGGARNYPENPFAAMAMTRAQRQVLLDQRDDPSSALTTVTSGVSTTGSGQEDADDLWVVISNTALRCDEYPQLPMCGGHWEVNLMLTESMQQVGIHDLAGEWFGQSYSAEADDPSMPAVCGGGGGGGISCGTFEMLEINESEIRFRLDADPWAVDEDIAGIYTISLCPM
ncbi:MAG TPA: hypothetical protein VFU02_22345 [Polyangiaceae bacterium]|nr:hypothetical protein [Polyangiaceae bacterium]